MRAQDLIATLAGRGVRLVSASNGLVAKPASRLTDADRQAIRTHKAELLAVLAGPADCLELLEVMHAELRDEYVEGALPWALASVPELAQRFHDTEAAIDRLAETRPTEADFRGAIEAHAAVWREIVARHRAHRERQAEMADPMPERPEDTVLAGGISYGDGKPGTWGVVRQGRKQ